jgi:acyl-CoA reductase-like NAD-dependent aldehyde dehydrogenase
MAMIRPATATIVRSASNTSGEVCSNGQRVRSDKLVGVSLLAELGNLAQLVLAERKEIALEFRLKQWMPLW